MDRGFWGLDLDLDPLANKIDIDDCSKDKEDVEGELEGNLSWEVQLRRVAEFREQRSVGAYDNWTDDEVSIPGIGGDLSSVEVCAGEYNGAKLRWVLTPKENHFFDARRRNKFLTIVVKNTNGDIFGNNGQLPVKIKMTIDEVLLKGNGNEKDDAKHLQKHTIESVHTFTGRTLWFPFVFKAFSGKIENINEFIVLRIKCQIRFVDQVVFRNSTPCHSDFLLSHLRNSNTSPLFPDFTIKVGQVHFQKHKVILAQSPVLLKLLESDMEESSKNLMEIQDFSPETVSQMLEFLYSGKIILNSEISENFELLKIADKYQILELKDGLQVEVAKNLEIRDACEVLILADVFDFKILREKAIKFINKQGVSVVKTEEFNELSKELLVELYIDRVNNFYD